MMRYLSLMKAIFILIFASVVLVSGKTGDERLKRASEIAGTPHNISILRGKEVILLGDTTLVDSMICRNCHPPHIRKGKEPRWDRNLPVRPFPFKTTTGLEPGKVHPIDYYSRVCLSCHDGILARFFPYRKNNILQKTVLGLREDLFPTNLYTHLFIFDRSNPELRDPDLPEFPLSVDSSGYIRCGTCHNPHNNSKGKFLRVTSNSSRICMVCHQPLNWERSIHGNPSNPEFYQLRDWACLQCHEIHTLPARPGLLKQEETTLCLSCHDASRDAPAEIPARKDLSKEFEKPYKHPLYINQLSAVSPVARGIMRWSESGFQERSVKCTDCHNPHSADEAPKIGFLPGSLFNVEGVTHDGMPVKNARFEYQICYKCHGLNKNLPPSAPIVSDQFSLLNVSYHPVEGPVRNAKSPSLFTNRVRSILITCSDCHGNNDPFGVKGVHGSSYPGLLKYRFESDYLGSGNDQEYAELCYQCHRRGVIIGNNGFRWHRLHIKGAGFTCAACHSPHGSRELPALLDFKNTPVIFKNGIPPVVENTPGHGTCNLICHGHNHTNIQF